VAGKKLVTDSEPTNCRRHAELKKAAVARTKWWRHGVTSAERKLTIGKAITWMNIMLWYLSK